jgi:hypothetical protein
MNPRTLLPALAVRFRFLDILSAGRAVGAAGAFSLKTL